jgi:uncharacterized membrane protein YeiB
MQRSVSRVSNDAPGPPEDDDPGPAEPENDRLDPRDGWAVTAYPETSSKRSRLPAIDVARGIALIGMMAVHVLTAGDGVTGAVHTLAGGRSAALFAVLAGVGLALGSGGSAPSAEQVHRARRAIPVRAAVIGGLGLTLGLFATPIAIILVYYAVLFLCALPVLGWSARRLALLAVGWALLSPVLSQLLRSAGLNDGPGSNPSWVDLADPGNTALHLLLNGYYPVLTWVTYLLAGLAVGRLVLDRPATGRLLALTGAGLALVGWLAATLCVRWAGGERALGMLIDPGAYIANRGDHLLDETFFGTTPTESWWFLGVMAPHSGAIPDLVHTTGTALLVIGVALILVPRDRAGLLPLAAAGSMTLTLYAGHAVLLGALDEFDPDHSLPVWPVLIVNVVLALFVATWWGSPGRRGPLEDVVASVVEMRVPR